MQQFLTWMNCRRRQIGAAAVTALVIGSVLTVHAQGGAFENGQAADVVVGQPDFDATTSAVSADGLTFPHAVAVDTVRRKLYVADAGNHRVLRFDLDEAIAGSPTAEAVFGQPDFTTSDLLDPPTAASMFLPNDLALDPVSGSLYVADVNNRRLLRFDDVATAASGASAALVLGQPDFTTVGETTSITGTTSVTSVRIGVNGELWVADGARILRWDNPGSLSNGAPADGVLGQPDFTSAATGLPTQQSFNGTVDGLAVSPSGALFAADEQAARILRWDNAANAANGAPADAVLGQPGFTSRDAGNTATTLDSPEGMVVDSNGRLYVADNDNYRIVWYDNADELANGAPADGALGDTDLNGTVAVGLDRTFRARNVALGADNELWVPDRLNNRVLLFTYTPLEEPEPTEPTAPQQCELLPDMAVSPQFIELLPGGTAQIEVALRNLCKDKPFNYSDVLLSLSDGIVVTDVPAGWLDLGQRAALQGLSLGLGETRSWTLTVAAADPLPTAPLHVLELYYRGAAAVRIDGVFVPAAAVAAPEVPAAVEAPAVAEVSAAPVVESPQLPAVLPNTAGPLLPLGALVLSGLALAALGAIGRRRG